MPVMASLRSANGILRFCETCNAAMNWPWFLKPFDASFSVRFFGSSVCIFGERPLFDEIFSAMGFNVSGAGIVVVVVEPVVVDPLVGAAAAVVVVLVVLSGLP